MVYHGGSPRFTSAAGDLAVRRQVAIHSGRQRSRRPRRAGASTPSPLPEAFLTDIPEHLLRRSRERREALGLSTGEGGAPPPARDEGGADEGGEAAGAAVPVEPEPAPAPEPMPPYVVAAVSRQKIPWWALPVLAALPLWAIIYAGTMVT